MPSPFPNVPPTQRGAVHRDEVASRALLGNPLGDPADRDLYVYTPPGYDTSGARYPAVLVLPAFAGTGEGLLARGLSDISFATRVDRLVAEGCPPFLAVFPDVMTTLVGSQYLDSPHLGAYATYVLEEIRAHVDAHYRTTGRWGAVGRSSGGFGALSLAMDRPGALQAVACHAGDMGFDLAYLGDLGPAVRGLQSVGGPDRLAEAFWARERVGGDLFAAMNLTCMAAAYSRSAPSVPLEDLLPVCWRTGEVRFEVLEAWREHDPIRRAATPAGRDALTGLDLLFLDAGDRDEYHLHLGLRRLTEVLDAGRVPYVHEEFPGGHRGTAFRYDASLPRLAAALTRGSDAPSG